VTHVHNLGWSPTWFTKFLFIYMGNMARISQWHTSTTLVDLQLDTQNSCLFTWVTWRAFHSDTRPQPWLISNLIHKILVYLHIIHLLKSSTCFEHYPSHLQEVYVIIVCMQPLVSSLFAGDCLVHRLRKQFFLNRCTRQSPAESDDTRGCIYTIMT